MDVRVDQGPKPIRKCDKSGNKNVHFAGANQQDKPPRIFLYSRIRRITGAERQKQGRDRGENDSDNNEEGREDAQGTRSRRAESVERLQYRAYLKA